MSILTNPYPKDSDLKKKVFTAFIFGNFVFIFLFLFQPFGISEWDIPNKALVLSGYGAITFLAVLFNSVIIEKLLNNWFAEKNWKVWKEIIWALWNILLIGTLNLLYSKWQMNFKLSFVTFFAYQWITLLIGIIPTAIITLWNHNRLQKKNLEEALILNKVINAEPLSPIKVQSSIILSGDNAKESVELDPQQIWYMEAADNYVEVVWFSGTEVKKKLLRTTLKKMEEQLVGEPYLFRCHRSYLVNLRKVISVTGNSQGYKLVFEGNPFMVPVSRSLNDMIRQKMEELHPHEASHSPQ